MDILAWGNRNIVYDESESVNVSKIGKVERLSSWKTTIIEAENI